MTIEECYARLGGDYADVGTRLPGLSIVERFLVKFLDDPSFSDLCANIEKGDKAEAFRAAHTLKGVCAKMGFGKLLAVSQTITEALRGESAQLPENTSELLENVKLCYGETTEAIRLYIGSK